jgi:hypothetical protein
MPTCASAQPAIASCSTGSVGVYQRREPERTLLHRIVRMKMPKRLRIIGLAAQADKPRVEPVGAVFLAAARSLAARSPKPAVRTVTSIQRFGSAVNLNLHFHIHTLVLDGVFFDDANGAMQFHALAPPTRGDLEKLLRQIVPRLRRLLTEEPEFPALQPWLQRLIQALQTGAARPVDDPPRGLCVLAEGFSLHAGVSVLELDGDALKRLARYCARPALALGRLLGSRRLDPVPRQARRAGGSQAPAALADGVSRPNRRLGPPAQSSSGSLPRRFRPP